MRRFLADTRVVTRVDRENLLLAAKVLERFCSKVRSNQFKIWGDASYGGKVAYGVNFGAFEFCSCHGVFLTGAVPGAGRLLAR
jgi:hypothetical protein